MPVGILGAGQLSMMLAAAARQLNLETIVLSERADDPATKVADASILGSFHDEEKILEIFGRCVVVVYENEFIDESLLNRCLARRPVTLLPAPWVMSHVANKLAQKSLFHRLGIPTARFSVYNPDCNNSKQWLQDLQQDYPGGFMLKLAKGGYDGKGNFPIFKTEDIGEPAEQFINQAMQKGIDLYAEERINFSHELALVSIQSLDGKMSFFPLVLSEQEHSICSMVRGPAVSLGIDPGLEDAARESCSKIAHALSLFGCFAVEFFLSEQGLIVNELAPRVHNSGHFSQDAYGTSQFAAHWQALLGLPVVLNKRCEYFGMLNILGPEGFSGVLTPPRIECPGVVLHWYHKRESHPRRKLGHINILAASAVELDQALATCRAQLTAWKENG